MPNSAKLLIKLLGSPEFSITLNGEIVKQKKMLRGSRSEAILAYLSVMTKPVEKETIAELRSSCEIISNR